MSKGTKLSPKKLYITGKKHPDIGKHFIVEFRPGISVFEMPLTYFPGQYHRQTIDLVGNIFYLMAKDEIKEADIKEYRITRSEFVMATMVPTFSLHDDRVLIALDNVDEKV